MFHHTFFCCLRPSCYTCRCIFMSVYLSASLCQTTSLSDHLFVRAFLHLSICLSISTCLCLSVDVPVYLSTIMYTFAYLLSACLMSVRLPVRPSISRSVRQCFSLPFSLSLYLFDCLTIHFSSLYLPVCLSVYSCMHLHGLLLLWLSIRSFAIFLLSTWSIGFSLSLCLLLPSSPSVLS